MKKTKFKPELLNEELKKFRLLCEYDFYQEKKEAPEYKDIILGSRSTVFMDCYFTIYF